MMKIRMNYNPIYSISMVTVSNAHEVKLLFRLSAINFHTDE